jgi:two-component system, chemotaxis family, CheB/CheR fusion protein
MSNEDPSARAEAAKDEPTPVSPDIGEVELADQIDNIVPSYGYEQMPMVGLGGSAGSIGALESFFKAMSPNSGMVFVVVLHLSPDHESALPAMMQRWTSMRVQQAQNGHKVEPNHVYVIPPGKHLTAVDGHLRLAPLQREMGKRVAVDLFFRSLADSHGPHAAAIVLSGADGDGALGVKRIKERGGLTIAQDPDEAEYDSMPRAAIDSGMIDWVLNVEEMPERIVNYVTHEERIKLPPENPQSATATAAVEAETAFREILVFLRTRTGRDFSYYKRATILRRIARRMQVNSVEELPEYLAFLRTHPGEAGALLKDLLISVTNFFRDRDAFEQLEARIPLFFEGKGQGDTVRVWSPACATGEEAYSLAMMLIEHAKTLDVSPAIQVFGCDLDEDAIQAARAGIYPEAIAADVSEERLRRFFVKEHRGYRVRRELREMVLFATHDLLKDAPFSRLDLVSCRNLLIYLNREAQVRALDIFHFALNAGGTLFLGSSESVEDGHPLFSVIDKKFRIYRKQPAARVGLPVPLGPGTLLLRQIQERAAAEHSNEKGIAVVFPPAGFSQTANLPLPTRRGRDPGERATWSELHFKLLERFGPPSVLVDRDHDVQHLSESAGRFLQMTGGEPTMNLLRLVHPSLRIELRALLFRAAQTAAPASTEAVPFTGDGQNKAVDISVFPASDISPDFMLVTFGLRENVAPAAVSPEPSAPESLVHHLERELEQLRGHLRDTVEQYEASTEELKASNEELQAMNEELRSATEELETSREELQSINEELTTVNQESRNKVEELDHANSDLQNLMSATAIATLFLDRDMRIMRFTDSAAPIFNLIPGDIGRPLSHLQYRIDYPDMAVDAVRVLEKLTPIVREVHGPDDVSYLARMLPYRTYDDRIAGVVLTFVDITERERTKRDLAEDLASTERLRQVGERVADDAGMEGLFNDIADAAIFVTHADAGMVQLLDEDRHILRVLAWKGINRELVDQLSDIDVDNHASCGIALRTGRRTFVDYTADNGADAEEWDRWHREVAGLRCGQSTPLIARSGRTIGIITTYWRAPHSASERELRFLDLLARQAADAVEHLQAMEALRAHVDELQRFNQAAVGRETRMIELKKEVNELAVRAGESPRYSLDFQQDVD